MIVSFHVDDGAFTTNSPQEFMKVKEQLAERGLKGSLDEEGKKFLGIYYDNQDGHLLLHQDVNVLQLKSLRMDDAKRMSTPMEPGFERDRDQREDEADQTH